MAVGAGMQPLRRATDVSARLAADSKAPDPGERGAAGPQTEAGRTGAAIGAAAASLSVTALAALGALAVPLGQGWGRGAALAAIAGAAYVAALKPARALARLLRERGRLREQEEIISLLLKDFGDRPGDWLWHFDREGRIDRVSDRFAAAAGQAHESLLGRDFRDLLRGLSAENAAIVLEVESDIETRSIFHDIVVKVDREGEEHWWRLTGKPSFDRSGAYTGYVGTAADITSERLSERRINFLAHYDALTGLLNRSKFTDHLKQAVTRLERYGTPFAVLYIDLDQFKSINDGRGHLVGDKLLAAVGKRISAVLGSTDVAARLGGDEFAVILGDNCSVEHISAVAGRLVSDICTPYHIDDDLLSVGASIGIAMAPINGTRPDQILRNADLALYRAKAEGRATFRFFEARMDSSMRERRMLEMELREALKEGEFVLHYQPLVSAEDHRPNGFEALMRWNHPIRGVVHPSEFIPIAEQSGLIQQIGDWTIREACFAAARWPEDLIVAVNISAKHFQLSDIVEVVRQALEDSKLPPSRLELEITESLLIQRPDDVIAKLTKIKALGVTIAMDDFGTGYSSLAYLLKFPFDKIKIDKSFVTASTEDTAARDILKTIVSLGKSLKIRVTAEGVETVEQVEFLRKIACNQLQGYYFAKPLDEPELASYFLSRMVSRRINTPPGEPGGQRLKVAV